MQGVASGIAAGSGAGEVGNTARQVLSLGGCVILFAPALTTRGSSLASIYVDLSAHEVQHDRSTRYYRGARHRLTRCVSYQAAGLAQAAVACSMQGITPVGGGSQPPHQAQWQHPQPALQPGPGKPHSSTQVDVLSVHCHLSWHLPRCQNMQAARQTCTHVHEVHDGRCRWLPRRS